VGLLAGLSTVRLGTYEQACWLRTLTCTELLVSSQEMAKAVDFVQFVTVPAGDTSVLHRCKAPCPCFATLPENPGRTCIVLFSLSWKAVLEGCLHTQRAAKLSPGRPPMLSRSTVPAQETSRLLFSLVPLVHYGTVLCACTEVAEVEEAAVAEAGVAEDLQLRLPQKDGKGGTRWHSTVHRPKASWTTAWRCPALSRPSSYVAATLEENANGQGT